MSNQIRTIIVDDEPLALKLLHAKLKKVADIDVIAQCNNGREAIQKIGELNPDLIFLDIQMPGITGLDVIKSLQSDIMPVVVFATAYEQYALDAFDANAVDYILKPIDDDRVARAIERAKLRLSIHQEFNNNKDALLNAVESIHSTESKTQTLQDGHNQELPSNPNNKIVVKDRDEIHIIEQTNIEWIDAAGDYVCIHSEGQTYIKRTTLKEILEELNHEIFKRVHRSTIVNLDCIKKVLPHTKGEFFLQLGEYDKIKVSRNYKEVIKDFLSSK